MTQLFRRRQIVRERAGVGLRPVYPAGAAERLQDELEAELARQVPAPSPLTHEQQAKVLELMALDTPQGLWLRKRLGEAA